ncbi:MULTISPECIES: hypothetical protein [Shewanella]|uniref:hypothetical protein n=1 Tax=Shewanella TaxID=22 RepID=UPI00201A53EF|nr:MULTISPECIES: hypothetical protein [Shewanella]
MSFYADILPMRKGNFRGGEYTKAKPTITENFQFCSKLKDEIGIFRSKSHKTVLSHERLSADIGWCAKKLWLINKPCGTNREQLRQKAI